jgi:hypothetical protein
MATGDVQTGKVDARAEHEDDGEWDEAGEGGEGHLRLGRRWAPAIAVATSDNPTLRRRVRSSHTSGDVVRSARPKHGHRTNRG